MLSVVMCYFLGPGAVALHEAVQHNSLECIKVLLALGAPAHPSSSVYQTPASLAKKLNYQESLKLLSRYNCQIMLSTEVISVTLNFITSYS